MFQPSEDQAGIVSALQTHNVTVVAAPGSGKTTLALHIVRSRPYPALILTYNNALNAETCRRLKAMSAAGAVPCDSFTYHGLVSRLSGQSCRDDVEMSDVLSTSSLPAVCVDEDGDPSLDLSQVRTVIIDECQDMRPLYWGLVQHVVGHAASPDLRVVVLGDSLQCLYHFYKANPADVRFLTMAPDLLRTDQAWKTVRMNTSFRIPETAARVVNAIFGTRIESAQPRAPPGAGGDPGPSVRLFVGNVPALAPAVVTREIQQFLRRGGAPGRAMVLFNSTNHRSPAVRVVQQLVRDGVPVVVHRSGARRDASGQCDDDRSGRVAVRTFHSAKGLEADLVVVVNLKPLVPDPGDRREASPLFVAMTRARHTLVVVQSHETVSACDLQRIHDADTSVDVQTSHACTRPQESLPAFQTWARDDGSRRYFSLDTVFSYVDPLQLKSWVQDLPPVTVLQAGADTRTEVPPVAGLDDAAKVGVDSIVHRMLEIMIHASVRPAVLDELYMALAGAQGTAGNLDDSLDALENARRRGVRLDVAAHLALLEDRVTYPDRFACLGADVSFAHLPDVARMYNRAVSALQPALPDGSSVWDVAVSCRLQDRGATVTVRGTCALRVQDVAVVVVADLGHEDVLYASALASMARCTRAVVVALSTGRCLSLPANKGGLLQAVEYHRQDPSPLSDESFVSRFSTPGLKKRRWDQMSPPV